MLEEKITGIGSVVPFLESIEDLQQFKLGYVVTAAMNDNALLCM